MSKFVEELVRLSQRDGVDSFKITSIPVECDTSSYDTVGELLKGDKWRRKPKTKLINGVEIPDISFTPSVGEMYYYPNPILYKWATDDLYREDCKFTGRLIELNLCYPFTDEGKQAAISHAKVMLGEGI